MSQPVDALEAVRVECDASPDFSAWISQAQGSLVVSTYQAGKVAMIGWDGRQTTLLMREFDKPLGLAVDHGRLALATRYDVTLFANAGLLAHDFLEQEPGRYDALYLPRASFHTGDLNTHDVAFQGEDLLLVNTRFSCLARLSTQFNFTPFWRPSFVTDLVPEDRCHLNGLAMEDGRPRFVTALGTTDAAGAWRENKAQGGVLIDLSSGQVVLARAIDAPLAALPRRPGVGAQLGHGRVALVDPLQGRSVPVCRLPGYLRGLAFAGPYALVGLSKIRERHIFGGLPIQKDFDCAAVRRGGGRLAERPFGGPVRVYRGVRGAVRRAVSPGRAAADDSQPAEGSRPPGHDQPGIVLLVASQFAASSGVPFAGRNGSGPHAGTVAAGNKG